MNISFFLDAKLIKKNNLYYTTGAVDLKYLSKHKITDKDHLTVFCRKGKNNEIEINRLALASGDNITFITVNSYNEAIKSKKIKNIIKESDLCFSKLPSIIGLLSCRYINKYKKPQIIEMVGCPFDAMKSYGTIIGKILAPFLYLINVFYIKKAKNVIYVTNRFLQKRYTTKGNSIGCSDVELDEINQEILDKRIMKINNKANSEIYKVGIIGSLNVDYKGHETAIKAIAKIKNEFNFELHFLGVGNKEKWIKLAEKHHIKENVIFDDVLPHEKVSMWLDDMDIYLIPSLVEGLPRALLEAMSRGCPTLGTNVGGIPELLDDDMLINKKDYNELAIKIREIILNKEKMIKCARRNFEISKEYSSENLNKSRYKFYSKVMSCYNIGE